MSKHLNALVEMDEIDRDKLHRVSGKTVYYTKKPSTSHAQGPFKVKVTVPLYSPVERVYLTNRSGVDIPLDDLPSTLEFWILPVV